MSFLLEVGDMLPLGERRLVRVRVRDTVRVRVRARARVRIRVHFRRGLAPSSSEG